MNTLQINRRGFVRSLFRGVGVALGATLCLGFQKPAHAVTNVVASLPELAAIAREVGGSDVSVYSVARPDNDYHRYEALPSDVARISRAKLVVATGMDFELWMTSLLNAAAKPNLLPGGTGYVNCSQGVRRIEVPSEQITGASGDIHSDGNPHFYYDPVYAKFIARNILMGLIRVDAPHADAYRANYTRFNAAIDARVARYRQLLAPFAGRQVVTYHQNYDYFLRRFGLRQLGTMEPKPGIPPTARHINALAQSMKANGVKAMIVETIYPTRYPQLLAKQVGGHYVVAPYSVGSLGTKNYFDFMDKLVDAFHDALN